MNKHQDLAKKLSKDMPPAKQQETPKPPKSLASNGASKEKSKK